MSGCCALLCFKPANNAWSLLFREWVAAVPCCISCLLTMFVLDSPVGVWLLHLAVFYACWQCLLLTLQWVSDLHALLHFKATDNSYVLAYQIVSGCHAFLSFKPANDACHQLTSWWVAAMPHCISRLFLTPVCYVQQVCGSILLHYIPADNICSLLFIDYT